MGPKAFLFTNMIFSVYVGAILVGSIQLIIGESFVRTRSNDNYTMLYDILQWYLLAAGLFLALLVILAVTAVYPRSVTKLNVYLGGMLILILSEIAFGAWLGTDINFGTYSQKIVGTTTEVSGIDPAILIASAFLVLGFLQIGALVQTCVLRREQFRRRDPAERFSADRGWKSSTEYRYHAGGQGTTCPRTSRRVEGHELWASAPPALPEGNYDLPEYTHALPAYSPPHSSRDLLVNNR